MAYKVEAKSVDRKGNPKAKFSFFGKTKSAAKANARAYFRKARNIMAGFYDEDGEFHPIRASSDYDPSRAGDSRPKRTKRKTRRKKNTRLRRAVNRRRTTRRKRSTNRRPAVRRRRKNKMPPALARYWRTHKRTGKKKNRRRK